MAEARLEPDEIVYTAQAETIREMGPKAFRLMARHFLAEPGIQVYPSPIRWLWTTLTALTLRVPRLLPLVSLILAPLAAVWALAGHVPAWAALLCAASPALHIVSRRRLQDGPVAALTLVALGFALRGNGIGVAITVAALLSVKEAALFATPAVFAATLYSPDPSSALYGLAGGVAAWAVGLSIIYGPRLALRTLRAASAGHSNPYAAEHQKGAPHRLIVDLALVSPAAVIAACVGHGLAATLALVLVAVHALAPIRNLRFIIAADLLIRCAAVAAIGDRPGLLGAMIGTGLFISFRLRAIYDPVTANLVEALGMHAPSQ